MASPLQGRQGVSAGRSAYRFRWWRFVVIAGGLIGCLAGLVWFALWLRVPPPAHFILVTADDPDDWTFPHNAYGRAGVTDLTASTNDPISRRGTPRLDEIRKLSRGRLLGWADKLGEIREPTVVVCFSLHGGNDPEGPFLFPGDVSGNFADRLRLKSVLERLATLPAKKHKCLILDVTSSPAFPGQGVLHNDFASGLLALESQIKGIPNLVVIASSGIDQRSWTSPEWRRTVFGHFLREGLHGQADVDRDNRLTVAELFKYLAPNVAAWSRDHRAALQVPLMLPSAHRPPTRRCFGAIMPMASHASRTFCWPAIRRRPIAFGPRPLP
ncbi:MAG: hypothetical protein K8T89_14925 [Planctomycetes bacterium]|nr:hypothetical protein [Planctomycetota bacterium]